MGIVKKDPANFNPDVTIPTKVDSFRFWCQKVLPLVYDDSLSYYELLCKVVNYLNNTIEDINTLSTDVDNLNKAYNKLQNYVNNYFDSLDVQQEINKKLDEMAIDGTLQRLIGDYINNMKVGNILNYGADNTGLTNSTNAIIECSQNYDVIYFPKGKYLCDNLTFTNKEIVGANATIINHNTAGYAITLNNSIMSNITVQSDYNSESKLNGILSTSTTGAGNLQKEILSNVFVTHFGGDGITFNNTANITNCRVEYCNGKGIYLKSTDNILNNCTTLCTGGNGVNTTNANVINGGAYYWGGVKNGDLNTTSSIPNLIVTGSNSLINTKLQDSFKRQIVLADNARGNIINISSSSCGENTFDGVPIDIRGAHFNKITCCYGNGFVNSQIKQLITMYGNAFYNDINISFTNGADTQAYNLYSIINKNEINHTNKITVNNIDYSKKPMTFNAIRDNDGRLLDTSFNNIYGFTLEPFAQSETLNSFYISLDLNLTKPTDNITWSATLNTTGGHAIPVTTLVNKYNNQPCCAFINFNEPVRNLTVLANKLISGSINSAYFSYTK